MFLSLLQDFLNSLTHSLSLSLFLSLSCSYALSLSLSLSLCVSLKAGCLIVMMSAASLFAFCRQRANGHRWGFSRFASFHSSLSRTLSLRSISISLSLSLSLSLSWHHRDRIQRSFDQRELWEGFAFSLIFPLLVFASAKKRLNIYVRFRKLIQLNVEASSERIKFQHFWEAVIFQERWSLLVCMTIQVFQNWGHLSWRHGSCGQCYHLCIHC